MPQHRHLRRDGVVDPRCPDDRPGFGVAPHDLARFLSRKPQKDVITPRKLHGHGIDDRCDDHRADPSDFRRDGCCFFVRLRSVRARRCGDECCHRPRQLGSERHARDGCVPLGVHDLRHGSLGQRVVNRPNPQTQPIGSNLVRAPRQHDLVHKVDLVQTDHRRGCCRCCGCRRRCGCCGRGRCAWRSLGLPRLGVGLARLGRRGGSPGSWRTPRWARPPPPLARCQRDVLRKLAPRDPHAVERRIRDVHQQFHPDALHLELVARDADGALARDLPERRVKPQRFEPGHHRRLVRLDIDHHTDRHRIKEANLDVPAHRPLVGPLLPARDVYVGGVRSNVDHLPVVEVSRHARLGDSVIRLARRDHLVGGQDSHDRAVRFVRDLDPDIARRVGRRSRLGSCPRRIVRIRRIRPRNGAGLAAPLRPRRRARRVGSTEKGVPQHDEHDRAQQGCDLSPTPARFARVHVQS